MNDLAYYSLDENNNKNLVLILTLWNAFFRVLKWTQQQYKQPFLMTSCENMESVTLRTCQTNN